MHWSAEFDGTIGAAVQTYLLLLKINFSLSVEGHFSSVHDWTFRHDTLVWEKYFKSDLTLYTLMLH